MPERRKASSKTIQHLYKALKAAEVFIADELECRQRSYAPLTDKYVASAARCLKSIRAAIAKAEFPSEN